MKANKQQRQLIGLLRRKFFPTEEMYRDALQDNYQVSSCTELTVEQASEFIKTIGGGELKPQSKTVHGSGSRGRNRHLTHNQAARLNVLMESFGWDSKRVIGLIRHTIKVTKAPSMLTNQEGTKVILAMQNIIEGEAGGGLRLNLLSNKQIAALANRKLA